MTVKHINQTPGAAYTPAIVTSGLVFTSGQVGADPVSGTVPEDFESEVRLAIDNLRSTLADAGSDLSQLVRVTGYIADVELADVYNRVYLELIPEPRPTRATVEVRMLPPYRIELECVSSHTAASEAEGCDHRDH